VNTPEELPFVQGTLSDKAVQDLQGALGALWAGDWDAYGYYWDELTQGLAAITLLLTLVQLITMCVEGLRDHNLWPRGTDEQIGEFYLQLCQVVPEPYGLTPEMLAEAMDVSIEAAYGEVGGWEVIVSDMEDSASRLLSALATLLSWVATGLGLDPQQLAQEMAQACPALFPREG